jgi:hypothetical protein
MRKLLLLGAAAVALSVSGAANAASCTVSSGTQTCFIPAGDPLFNPVTSPDGSISADIGRTVNFTGNFVDVYWFYIPGESGAGSGGVQTSTTRLGLGGPTDLDFTNVDVFTGGSLPNIDGGGNFTGFTGGTDYTIPIVAQGTTGQSASTDFLPTDIPITADENNYIVIKGLSRGAGPYGGTVTFTPTPAVPEPATWAMMLFGFAGVGFGMRRRKKQETRVRFAF